MIPFQLNCFGLKHASTDSAQIEITFVDNKLLISIIDHGVGFEPLSPPLNLSGFGLKSMRERAEEIGGKLFINSQPSQGTKITLEIPFPKNELEIERKISG